MCLEATVPADVVQMDPMQAQLGDEPWVCLFILIELSASIV